MLRSDNRDGFGWNPFKFRPNIISVCFPNVKQEFGGQSYWAEGTGRREGSARLGQEESGTIICIAWVVMCPDTALSKTDFISLLDFFLVLQVFISN